jgi:hypothetical protein
MFSPESSVKQMRIGDIISIEDLGGSEEIDMNAHVNPSNFDEEGNLNKLGQI